MLAAGARLSSYIGATVGEIGFLRGIWLDGSKRLVVARGLRGVDRRPTRTCPRRSASTDGIRDRARLVRLPGHRPAGARRRQRVSFPPARSSRSSARTARARRTLVKLLCKLYEPTRGSILIDGEPLARIRSEDWRDRLAGAFQDFFRFEFRRAHGVGLGDVPRLDDNGAVVTAVGRAGADDVVDRWPAGLDTQLGPDLA